MAARKVNKIVGAVKNGVPECVQELGEAQPSLL